MEEQQNHPQPSQIRRIPGEGIEVRWLDGVVHTISPMVLRSGCPCAECRERRGDGESHARPLPMMRGGKGKASLLRVVEHESTEELRLDQIWGVGNYALGMAWGDGHTSGIYTFSYLRQLGGRVM